MPIGFQLGPLFIRFYGIIIMLGALAAAFLADHEARRRGYKSEHVWDGLLWVLIGGIIGARLWHVFLPSPSQMVFNPETRLLENPYFAGGTVRILDILTTWNGGLGIPGAVLGGAIALYFFTRRNRLDFLVWADIAAPTVALGQAIGRWGNYINQELYGAPTNLPWAVHIEPQYRLPEYRAVETYHPLFLYESLWNFANMAFLLWLSRRYPERLKKGDIFLLYLVIYPLGRFLLEFLRLDAAQLGGINANQWIMAVVAVVAAAVLVIRHRQSPAAAAVPARHSDAAGLEETESK